MTWDGDLGVKVANGCKRIAGVHICSFKSQKADKKLKAPGPPGPLPNRPGASTHELKDSAAQSQDVHLRLSKALHPVKQEQLVDASLFYRWS